MWSAIMTYLTMVLQATSVAAPAGTPSLQESRFGGVLAQTGQLAPNRADENSSQMEQLIVTHTNRFRSANQLQALETNSHLTSAAEYFAAYLARTGKVDHFADGRRPSERAVKYGYEYCVVAENLASHSQSKVLPPAELARRFVSYWKNSPGHRKNLLDSDLSEIGVGVARDQQSGTFYAVQMFGRPKSQEIVVRLANPTDVQVHYEFSGESYDLPPNHMRMHRTCRPTELTFHGSEPGDDKVTQTPQILRPQSGDRYVVRQNERGIMSLEKR